LSNRDHLHVLAIVNGDPLDNAGARLRIANWVASLPAKSAPRVSIQIRPKRFQDLFQAVSQWLIKSSADHRDASSSTSRVVIVQKAFSLEMVALLLWLRLRQVAVVQDVCDPPIKVFNPEPMSKSFFAIFYLSLISRYLVDHLTVSSSVLARSFSDAFVPVTYIPDCIDDRGPTGDVVPEPMLHTPVHPSSMGGPSRPELKLLWFGNAARAGSHSGIDELYMATPLLLKLCSRFDVSLDVCTLLEAERFADFQAWIVDMSSLEIAYYPWSLSVQNALLERCHYCFLPRLQSLATFYKSPNRVLLAACHGRRTLSNIIASDDYEDLAVLMPSDLAGAPSGFLPDEDRFSPDQFPLAWSRASLCQQWCHVLHQANVRRHQNDRTPLGQHLLLRVLLLGLSLFISLFAFSKSMQKRFLPKQLRKLPSKDFLRSSRRAWKRRRKR
jgi:hypothetical protein